MSKDMFGNDLTETDSFGTPVGDEQETVITDEVLCECGEPLEAIGESRCYFQFRVHGGGKPTVQLGDCTDVWPLSELEFACEDPQCDNLYGQGEVIDLAREQSRKEE